MLHADAVAKSFGRVPAVRALSLHAERGEVVGLLGPNGAGKTTTIRMIAGVLTPDAGTITVDELDTVHDGRRARQRIGYLPESAPLYPDMTPESYTRHRAALAGVPRAAAPGAVNTWLDRLSLRDVRHRRIGQLSKGFRQRVALAGTLVHAPGLVILDEPTNGLDPSQVRDLRALIAELARGALVVLSSHVLEEVASCCTRIVVVARGRVLADAPASELPGRAGLTGAVTAEFTPGARDARTELDALGDVRLDGPGPDGRVTLRAAPTRDTLRQRREAVAGALHRAGAAVLRLEETPPTLAEAFAALIERAAREDTEPVA